MSKEKGGTGAQTGQADKGGGVTDKSVCFIGAS